jgi:hypothetical protein
VGSARQLATGELAGVAAKEAEYQRQLAAQEAKRIAEKEAQAASTFASRTPSIASTLKLAATHAAQGKWEEAEKSLDSAQSILDAFKGTRVETSPQSVDLASQIAAQRKRIEPGLAQLKKAREERERQLAVAEEAKRKREEALQNARLAAEAAQERSRRVKCCDGTISPSCLCNRSKRGCCSHHGGVCGCE